jgi:hypothetical protein|tara:strand:+ start:7961 stop:8134 length:174 start_codon:yes stop_codon:yes gene_type:complete
MTHKNIHSLGLKLVNACKNLGFTGSNFNAGGYYCMFNFRPIKPKCKSCGKELGEEQK